MEGADNLASVTLDYLQQLTLMLSPYPNLSSSTAQKRIRHDGLVSADGRSTNGSGRRVGTMGERSSLLRNCPGCRAELIGGLNSSFRIIRGATWSNCEFCGWNGQRPITVNGNMMVASSQERILQIESKRQFRAVRQRRRHINKEQSKTATGEIHVNIPVLPSSYGTSFLGQGSLKKLISKQDSGVGLDDMKVAQVQSHATSLDEDTFPSLQEHRLPPSFQTPSNISLPQVKGVQSRLLDTAKEPPKKRKRAKQPVGLAALLELKKREKEQGSSSTSLDLQAFLKGV